MKKYFIHNGSQQEGPYTIKELKEKDITMNTHIWYDGLSDWVLASKIDELNDYFNVTPPPFNSERNNTPPPIHSPANHDPIVGHQKKSPWKIIITVAIIIAVGIIVINFQNGNISTNILGGPSSPSPKVLNSRSEVDPNATLLDYKQAVYATIYNEGGSGRILVTATIDQGKRHYEETREVFLAEKASKEVYIMFDGPKALGGEIRYDVYARSID